MTDPRYDLLETLTLLDAANAPGRGLAERVRLLLADRDAAFARLEARARQDDYGKLLEALDENRSLTLLALADAALDAGRDDEAAGWRWLGMAGKWPFRQRKRWHWTSGYYAISHHIPPELAMVIPSFSSGRKTQSAALQGVVDAIAAKKWTPGAKA